MGNLSAVEAALSFLGSIVVAMIPVYLRIRSELRKKEMAMRSVPPSGPSTAEREPEAEREVTAVHASHYRELWVREERIRMLHDELRLVGEDHGRTARALSQAQGENQRLKARLAELEGRAPDGDVHERPTPKGGMPRA